MLARSLVLTRYRRRWTSRESARGIATAADARAGGGGPRNHFLRKGIARVAQRRLVER